MLTKARSLPATNWDNCTQASFPCEYEIKVIGNNNPQFEIEVLHTIRKHCPKLAENCLRIKPSKEGKYLSMSITINAKNKKQLEKIYTELKSCKDVVMSL